MISSEQAHLLISKYRSERTRLRISFIARDKSVNLRVTAKAVERVEPPEQLSFVADNGDHCLTVLTGCRFEYGDEREVSDPAIRAEYCERGDCTKYAQQQHALKWWRKRKTET